MAVKAKRHTHKYHLVTTGMGKLWACALPDCNHYMPPYMQELLEGKGTICWKCNEMTTLNPVNMKTNKPLCTECMMEVTLSALTNESDADTDEDIP